MQTHTIKYISANTIQRIILKTKKMHKALKTTYLEEISMQSSYEVTEESIYIKNIDFAIP